MIINNIPFNLFEPKVPGTASMPITYDSTPNLFNIDQAQVQQAINQNNQNKINEEQERRKRADQSMKLKQFADTMRMINANKSGNYGASKIFSDRIAQRKLLAEQKQKEALLKTQQDEFVKNNPQYRNAIQLNTLFPGLKLPTAKDRRIVEGADKRKYYADTEELVLPNVKVPIDNVEQNKMILSERKEVGKNYKPVNEAVVGYKKLEDALKQKTGTAAYTSLVLFMKNLDGSVVKSDEVRAFGQAQGLLGNIAKQIEETKGQGMTDEMRVSILNLAKASTKHMIDGYDDYLAGTKSAYDGINLPSESIFSGYRIDREGLDFAPATVDFFLPRIELK